MNHGDRLAAPGETPIAELVSRIEAVRQARQASQAVSSFRWESGSEGLILWVEGAPRAPLIGQSIVSIAEGPFGVGAEAARAVQRRVPFRDARFTVAGEGPASGEWRLSGVPFFDSTLGHFLGYRGSARRPFSDEVTALPPAQQQQPGLFGTDLPPDALRQLVHELRTPLNAIMGFAEMIDGQFLGPAPDPYRARASNIREQAGQLLNAVDDLDTAARIETSRLPSAGQGGTDVVALLYRLHESHERVLRQGFPVLRMDFAPDLPLAKVEQDAAERMISRLLAVTVGLSQEGETLAASAALQAVSGKEMLCTSIEQPRSLRRLDEERLLDPAYAPPGYWPFAPALGVGFALRLVRNLAEASEGSLTIEGGRFVLALPPLQR